MGGEMTNRPRHTDQFGWDRLGAAALATTATFLPALAAVAAPPAPAPLAEAQEVVVTASPLGVSRFEIVQNSSVIDGDDLSRARAGTIGDAVGGEPGIRSSFFGQGAGRPIIRGLDGERIRVMSDGMNSIDAASISPDHAVPIDPLSADRIEIVRGPGTLLYGSSAIGGLVNVIEGRVPTTLPEAYFKAEGRALYGSNANEEALSVGATARTDNGFVFRFSTFDRDTDDYGVSGFANAEALANGVRDVVPNSDASTKGFQAGGSYIWGRGHFGIAIGLDESSYGNPTEPDDAVRIDLQQQRFTLDGAIDTPVSFIEEARLKFNIADYEHSELEAAAVVTTFRNDGWEMRAEATHVPVISGNKGVLGIQTAGSAFEAVGSEAFVPRTDTLDIGIFALENLDIGRLRLEMGSRIENRSIKNDIAALDSDFTSISVSGGASYRVFENWIFGATMSRSERAPSATELFANGPHLATNAFEVGNPNLETEVALSYEIALRHDRGPVRGGINLFWTEFSDFIFLNFDGTVDVDSGLDVASFIQSDATFRGGELEVEADLLPVRNGLIYWDGQLDYVWAEESGASTPLPRIPPFHYTTGLGYRHDVWNARVEVEGAHNQRRTAIFETKTDGFTFFNASVAMTPALGILEGAELRLDGRNLFNEFARTHVSFIKDAAPLPGRDIRLSLYLRY